MASQKPLIMRANRLFGASLVERDLVSIEALDAANERLLELLSNSDGDIKVSLLSILVHEKQAIEEFKLIEHQVEDCGLGVIDVRNMEVPEDMAQTLNRSECWATWTIPFDHVEDTHYLATAYYLSPAVRKFWEEKLRGKLIWYATTLESVSEFLDALEEVEKKKAAFSAK